MGIRKFLDISTAHVSPAAKAYLNRPAGKTDLSCPSGQPGMFADSSGHRWYSAGGESLVTYPTPYGWICFAHDEAGGVDGHEVPAELMAVFAYAQSKGCCYVMFDCDAEEIGDLPAWDEETGEVRAAV